LGRVFEFKIGEVSIMGKSPEAECVVPNRNAETGEVFYDFSKIFAKTRLLPSHPGQKWHNMGIIIT
jgi:uncharacterized protein YcbX